MRRGSLLLPRMRSGVVGGGELPLNFREQMSCAIRADLILCLSAAHDRGGGKSGIVFITGFHFNRDMTLPPNDSDVSSLFFLPRSGATLSGFLFSFS